MGIKEIALNTCKNALRLFENAASATTEFIKFYEYYPEFPTEDQRLKMETLFNNMMLANHHIEILMKQNGIKEEMMKEN